MASVNKMDEEFDIEVADKDTDHDPKPAEVKPPIQLLVPLPPRVKRPEAPKKPEEPEKTEEPKKPDVPKKTVTMLNDEYDGSITDASAEPSTADPPLMPAPDNSGAIVAANYFPLQVPMRVEGQSHGEGIVAMSNTVRVNPPETPEEALKTLEVPPELAPMAQTAVKPKGVIDDGKTPVKSEGLSEIELQHYLSIPAGGSAKVTDPRPLPSPPRVRVLDLINEEVLKKDALDPKTDVGGVEGWPVSGLILKKEALLDKSETVAPFDKEDEKVMRWQEKMNLLAILQLRLNGLRKRKWERQQTKTLLEALVRKESEARTSLEVKRHGIEQLRANGEKAMVLHKSEALDAWTISNTWKQDVVKGMEQLAPLMTDFHSRVNRIADNVTREKLKPDIIRAGEQGEKEFSDLMPLVDLFLKLQETWPQFWQARILDVEETDKWTLLHDQDAKLLEDAEEARKALEPIDAQIREAESEIAKIDEELEAIRLEKLATDQEMKTLRLEMLADAGMEPTPPSPPPDDDAVTDASDDKS